MGSKRRWAFHGVLFIALLGVSLVAPVALASDAGIEAEVEDEAELAEELASELEAIPFEHADGLFDAEAEAADDRWWDEAPDHMGYSASGDVYNDTAEAWERILQGMTSEQWYNQSLWFWEHQEVSNAGVLLGYEHLHEADIKDSQAFLKQAYEKVHGPGWLEKNGEKLTVLEVGAGIGRVTRALLLPVFGSVEVMEPVTPLMNKAKELNAADKSPHKVTQYHAVPLHKFEFKPDSYDSVWIQWVLLYMTDDDLARVLKDATQSLKPGGLIFIKENTADKGFIVDEQQGSVTRNPRLLEAIYQSAGLEVVDTAVQTGFDEELYPVTMWVLRKKEGGAHSEL